MTAQNKETYLESMNEEYKQKHYPEGSVFKAHKKAMKGVNAGLGLFFMGAFLAGSIAGLVWSINRTLEIIRDKEENMLGVGIGISVFFLFHRIEQCRRRQPVRFLRRRLIRLIRHFCSSCGHRGFHLSLR